MLKMRKERGNARKRLLQTQPSTWTMLTKQVPPNAYMWIVYVAGEGGGGEYELIVHTTEITCHY
jgi:hypothetical protein